METRRDEVLAIIRAEAARCLTPPRPAAIIEVVWFERA